MIYLIVFFIGFFLPFIGSRYGKVWASDLGEWLFCLWHKPHFPKGITRSRARQLKIKWFKLCLYGLFWGFFLSILFVCIDLYLPHSAQLWCKFFVFLMAILTIIDQQFCLLPDLFTIPLIFLGFGYAFWGGVIPFEMSFYGACYGFLLPAVAVFIASFFFSRDFGGGDVKMMVGLGAWLGILPLCLVLFCSFISFALLAFLKRKKAGPYGPHLAFPSIIFLFLTIFKYIPFL